jgi:hypothetical protein
LQEQYWANHYTQQQQDSVLIDLANQVRLCIEQVDHGIRHLDRYACSSKPQPEIIAIHKPQETEIQPSLISKPPSTNNQSPNLLIIPPTPIQTNQTDTQNPNLSIVNHKPIQTQQAITQEFLSLPQPISPPLPPKDPNPTTAQKQTQISIPNVEQPNPPPTSCRDTYRISASPLPCTPIINPPPLIPKPQNPQVEPYKPLPTLQSTTAHEVVSLRPPKILSLLPVICAINWSSNDQPKLVPQPVLRRFAPPTATLSRASPLAHRTTLPSPYLFKEQLCCVREEKKADFSNVWFRKRKNKKQGLPGFGKGCSAGQRGSKEKKKKKKRKSGSMFQAFVRSKAKQRKKKKKLFIESY